MCSTVYDTVASESKLLEIEGTEIVLDSLKL